MKNKLSFLCAGVLAGALSACGGGGADTPAAQTTPAAPLVSAMPPLSSKPVTLTATTVMGTAFWADGSTAIGGRGQPIGGVECLKSEDYHIHTHLAIIKDGEVLSIPRNIGLQGCAYELHTHAGSGVLHVETSTFRRFTLGQFFAVWGQPLERSNIAGITGLPVTVYLNDGSGLIEYQGSLADLELRDKREVTIVVGKAPPEIPSYIWTDRL